MAERTEPISFRLAATFARQLAESAAKHGQSPGEHARHLVVAALSDAGAAELRSELGALRDEARTDLAELRETVRVLRDDVATVCVALLVMVAKVDPAEAEAWAKENLSR